MKDGNTSVYAHLDKFNDTLEIFIDSLQEKCNCFSIDHTFLPNQYPVKKGDVPLKYSKFAERLLLQLAGNLINQPGATPIRCFSFT